MTVFRQAAHQDRHDAGPDELVDRRILLTGQGSSCGPDRRQPDFCIRILCLGQDHGQGQGLSGSHAPAAHVSVLLTVATRVQVGRDVAPLLQRLLPLVLPQLDRHLVPPPPQLILRPAQVLELALPVRHCGVSVIPARAGGRKHEATNDAERESDETRSEQGRHGRGSFP